MSIRDQFHSAANDFGNSRNAEDLALLLKEALALFDAKKNDDQELSQSWEPLEQAFDFQKIRVNWWRLEFLTEDQKIKISQCLAYALRTTINGGELSEPETAGCSFNVDLIYWYNSRESVRSDYHNAEAYRLAIDYIVNGTPIRTTNREGVGTKGTRKFEGIGFAPYSILVTDNPK